MGTQNSKKIEEKGIKIWKKESVNEKRRQREL